MEKENYIFTVSENENGTRIDKYIVNLIPSLSRSRIQNIIDKGNVFVNGNIVTNSSQKLKASQKISVTIPVAESATMVAKDIPLNIVYEDENFLVIDKQAGLTVHPGAGNYEDTMANALMAHCGDNLSGIGGKIRPGIVHRLDKDTSGLILAAKNDMAHQHLSEQISERTLERTYLAICWGVPKPLKGTIETNIGRSGNNRKKMSVIDEGGKHAVTNYEIKEILAGGIASLVECRLETGRTHQIRVHMTHIGHPLLGDKTYGAVHQKKLRGLPPEIQEEINTLGRQALHSHKLGVENPANGTHMEFSSPLPDDLQKVLGLLKSIKFDKTVL